MSDKAKPFREVLTAELDEVAASRKKRGEERRVPPTSDKPEPREPYERAGKSQLLGLSFSGGGIRSATFNLGVLQALADLHLLQKFDYLSTVSGGGYIGSWFASWMKRKGPKNPGEIGAKICDVLQTDRADKNDKKEPREVEFLREYSNYLTPRLGLFSADTWTMIVTYLRNTSLNLTILIIALSAVLLLPRFSTLQFYRAVWFPDFRLAQLAAFLLIMALTLLVMTVSSLFGGSGGKGPAKYELRSILVIGFVTVPLLYGAWWMSTWLWVARKGLSDVSLYSWAGMMGGLYFGLWLAGWFLGEVLKFFRLTHYSMPTREDLKLAAAKQALAKARASAVERAEKTAEGFSLKNLLVVFLMAFVSGAIGGLCLLPIARCMDGWDLLKPGWNSAGWGPPLVLSVFLLTATLHIGLAGRSFSEEAREWLGRLGATMLRWQILLTGLFTVAIFGPWGLLQAEQAWVKAGLGLGWVLTTLAGILMGKSPATGAGENNQGRLSFVAKVAPVVFVVGLLVVFAFFAHKTVPGLMVPVHSWAQNNFDSIHKIFGLPVSTAPNDLTGFTDTPAAQERAFWADMTSTLDGCILLFIAALAGVAVWLSTRVGINDFSMHAFYRNRLVRCYLGAANWEGRRPNPFTGFDPVDDEFDMQRFRPTECGYAGPLPIVNTALNLVGGEKLAWQQRKAASFVFTPVYCGYETDTEGGADSGDLSANGYRPAKRFGDSVPLGTAFAISGAAASPNMGYHSSAPLAFLMTVFNVRLGWWMGNPRLESTWQKSGPALGLFYLLCELIGSTNDKSGFVYLSDGGHFENLGIYELVRRRCRFIVACDAGADAELTFGDLGNAIEKCRTDFGVDIEIDVEQLRRDKDTGKSKWHCAVGKIHYENVDKGIPCGTILYLKSSLTGDEPTDVQRYASENPEFPHQSTADQFFDESQFESYRELGHHAATSVLEAVGDEQTLPKEDLESLFLNLRQAWHAPSEANEKAFTKHTATLHKIQEAIRSNKNLHFLDPQIYPEWHSLVNKLDHAPKFPPNYWLPPGYEERRDGFYVCIQMIQLMEDVYLDLNLEQEYDHPDNRGWMNLFKHWSWSGMFCATWAIAASTYGARFQLFCKRRLDLDLGTVQLGKSIPILTAECRAELKQAEESLRINFWEAKLIRGFIARDRGAKMEDALPFPVHILPFQIVVKSPTREPGEEMAFTFGFALANLNGRGSKTEIWYFRVQNHLRKMGLARKALGELMRQYGKESVVSKIVVPPEIVRQGVAAAKPDSGLSIEEALPTEEMASEFQQLLDSVKGQGA